MKKQAPNQYRIRDAMFPSNDEMGMRGMFRVPTEDGRELMVTVNLFPHDTDTLAVSLQFEKPTKEHVELVKRMFWDEHEHEDLVAFTPDLEEIGIKGVGKHIVHIRKRKNNWNLKTIKK